MAQDIIIMTLCFFCLSLPPKLFSYKSNDQCIIDHHSSYLSLQESGKGECELCNLLLHAIQKRFEDSNYEGHIPSWSTTEAITVRSTKFISQVISIGHKEVGAFRGRLVPPEWSEGYSEVFRAGQNCIDIER